MRYGLQEQVLLPLLFTQWVSHPHLSSPLWLQDPERVFSLVEISLLSIYLNWFITNSPSPVLSLWLLRT